MSKQSRSAAPGALRPDRRRVLQTLGASALALAARPLWAAVKPTPVVVLTAYPDEVLSRFEAAFEQAYPQYRLQLIWRMGAAVAGAEAAAGGNREAVKGVAVGELLEKGLHHRLATGGAATAPGVSRGTALGANKDVLLGLSHGGLEQLHPAFSPAFHLDFPLFQIHADNLGNVGEKLVIKALGDARAYLGCIPVDGLLAGENDVHRLLFHVARHRFHDHGGDFLTPAGEGVGQLLGIVVVQHQGVLGHVGGDAAGGRIAEGEHGNLGKLGGPY